MQAHIFMSTFQDSTPLQQNTLSLSSYCSIKEADPVAFECFAAGFNVVLVHQYSVKENASQFHPLLEAGKIIMTIRNHVDEMNCPTFLCYTVTHQSVSVENTLGMILELQKHHVSYECHIFPEGSHGMSVCTEEVGTSNPCVQR